MSTKRWAYLDFLSGEEKATLDAHDQQILWLKVRLSWHDRQRYKIVNAGTQRARAEAKRRTNDLERKSNRDGSPSIASAGIQAAEPGRS